MFSKKELEMGTTDAASALLNAASVTQKPKVPSRAVAPSIFSSDVVVVGDLKSKGDIQFDGQIEGSIQSVSLTVGETAMVKGEVIAEKVIVRGRVLGSVCGKQVELLSTSHVEGDIVHATLSVETGAFFEGACRRNDNPLATPKGKNSAGKSASKDKEKAADAEQQVPNPLRAQAS